MATPALGRAIRRAWRLDPDFVTVNHGSFGATPECVLLEQDNWRRRMESQPTRFMGTVLPRALREAAGRLAEFLGASGDDIAFVDNATTGCNAVLRSLSLQPDDEILVLDVPWLPSQIEQREGRIERQGNQHEEIEIYAYATLGSMDATMWQNNERKARFIEAALSGDRTIRRLKDDGGQANQFAMAKAIASGDSRLMRKAGLESEIARLQRQRAAHMDDQHAIRRQIRDATRDQAHAEARVRAIMADLLRRTPTRGDAFAMEVEGRAITERRTAGGS